MSSSQVIAQMLIDRGVKQGDVVAVAGDRSFGLIASMLGILASGGVLLTLDRNLPEQRQRLMLATATAKILLDIGNQRSVEQGMEECLEIISINPNNGQVTAPQPRTFTTKKAPIAPAPDDAAYLFFTSGTTGTPKGVLGCHKGLAHFLNWQRQTFKIQPQDRVAQLTGLSFDVVLREIFLPLTSGATLCLPEPCDDLTPASIVRFRKLVAEELEVVEVPGSHTGILVEPHAQLLAEKLRNDIDRFLEDNPTG